MAHWKVRKEKQKCQAYYQEGKIFSTLLNVSYVSLIYSPNVFTAHDETSTEFENFCD